MAREHQQKDSGTWSPEVIVRRAALALVALLILVAYLLRSKTPEPAASVNAAPASANAAPASPPSAAAFADRVEIPASERIEPGRSEAALARPPPAPSPPPPSAAVDLPEATPRVPNQAVAARELGPKAPCGGLFVRLITQAPDDEFASASLATSFAAPAQVVHVGESIGGFRVQSIEWDRVWVQSARERCAVGMHFGAREAEEASLETLSAEDYAKLPWVLPETIVSGLGKRSEMDFELDPAAIAGLYERGADVFAGLRIKVIEGAESRALQLFDIRIDSFLERLGIEHEDILVSIDEKPADSVEAVVKILEGAREHESLVASFTRDGEPFQLSLRVRQDR